jgi:UDP-2,3-diacylglucosamine pyrophosphatase LpxH
MRFWANTLKTTVILSDLHLCEAEPVDPKRPFWKKYKTAQFFFDNEFEDLLLAMEEQFPNKPLELILNGDIFDFDSVMALPENPSFRVTWLEKKRGLFPEPDKSEFKIRKILKDHPIFINALSKFIKKGHDVVLIIGNHDVELHFHKVQKAILEALNLEDKDLDRFRVCELFYISENDTLVEHGNQYDPFCMVETPIRPFIIKNERLQVRIPFGNLATRYLINGMGYFNPHSETNFIMSAYEYTMFFLRYMVKTQPLIMFTWFWSALVILFNSISDKLQPPVNDPLTYETKIEEVAYKANAKPRMVREMLQLAVSPATSSPLLIAKELWLDRAFLFVIGFLILVQIFFIINQLYNVSFYWVLFFYMLFLPFFVFYSRTVTSDVQKYKEPREKVLTLSSLITGVKRVVYGHTHHPLHEIIGPVEHLNSGTWSPNFGDVECKIQNTKRNYIIIQPIEGAEGRVASLEVWE